MLENAVTLTWY